MKILSVNVDAGVSSFESPAAEYKELGLSLDNLLITNSEATYLAKASGHSMTGVKIFDGDIIIIDRSQDFEHLDTVVANFNGNFVCKILDTKRGYLLSASDDYPPVKITSEDTFQIEGVVTSSISLFKHVNRVMTCIL